MARTVRQELQELRASRVRKVLRDRTGRMGTPAHKGLLAQQGRAATRVPRAPPVLGGCVALRVRKVRQELQEQRVLLERVGLVARTDRTGTPAHKVRQGRWGRAGSPALQEHPACKAPTALPGRKGFREPKVRLVPQDRRAILAASSSPTASPGSARPSLICAPGSG